jgi:L-amino acid N-acyltransferase YncA
MYQFTSKRRLSTIAQLSVLERQQLVEVAQRLWGEEFSEAQEAFDYQDFGQSCILWTIEEDGAPLFELWADGDPWVNGALVHSGTAKLAPIALIQRRFTSLVQGFEEIAAALDGAPKKLEPKQNPEYLLRRATAADAEAIVALLNPIIEAGNYTIMEPLTLAEQRTFMRDFPARGIFLVAVHKESGVLNGLQSVEPLTNKAHQHVGEISTFVSRAAQRKKLGQTLSQETFRQAKELGFRKLMATVRDGNGPALTFYQSLGFEEIGRAIEHALAQGKYIDEVFLEKMLHQQLKG